MELALAVITHHFVTGMLNLPGTLRSLVAHFLSPNLDPVYTELPLRVEKREIRLVYVEQGTWTDEIKCRLQVVSLEDDPQFEAISYAWGDWDQTKPIRLNNHSVEVGVNLETALRRLRKPDQDRALWADAISINQHDVQERNEQVLLMTDIYSQCQNVLIWLGQPRKQGKTRQIPHKLHEWVTDFSEWEDMVAVDELDEASMMKFEQQIISYYRLPFALRHNIAIDNYLGAYCLLNRLAQNKHVTQDDISFLLNHDAFHRFILALDEIMHCAWWSRQWVIQEVVLPQKVMVHFGNFAAPWELFGRAAGNYEYHRTHCCKNHYTYLRWKDIRLLENFSRTVTEMDDLRQNWHATTQGESDDVLSLRQLLWKFRDRSTSDPRDKVYTLLPLVTWWNGQLPISPDYYPPTQHVFREATKRVVAVDGSLDIFMGTMEKGLPDLPSWVPDWTTKPSQFEEERLERCVLFHASLDHPMELEFVNDSILELSGVFFDGISELTDPMDYSREEVAQELFARWYSFVGRDNSITAPYPAGGSKLEAYWRTLCLDTARNFSRPDSGKRYSRCSKRYVAESLRKWMDLSGKPLDHVAAVDEDSREVDPAAPMRLRREDSVSPSSGIHASQPDVVPDEKLGFVAVDFAICSATWKRRLFLTKSGYLGVGPPSMTKGDRVYVFGGGSMPFVLRYAGERTIPGNGRGKRRTYQLLGEAYVHGIMDGEAAGDYAAKKQSIYLV